MTDVQDQLPEALARLADRAPTTAPSSSALLAAHRRRSRRTRAAAGIAAVAAVTAVAAGTQHLLQPTAPAAARIQTAPTTAPTPTPEPPADIKTLLKGPDLDQRWAQTLGTLATDDAALTAIRARAVDLLFNEVEDRVGDTTKRWGFYRGRKAAPQDLRILLATDLRTPSGAAARVALISAPPVADPPHRALYWLFGPSGAAPSTLHATNCQGPFICVLQLGANGLPPSGSTGTIAPDGHRTVTAGGAVEGYLVAAPPGSAVTVEAHDRQVQPTGRVLGTAAPVADIPGLYTLPPGKVRSENPEADLQPVVSRSNGEVLWWEPFVWRS